MEELIQQIRKELLKRLIEENTTRIKSCMDKLSEEDLHFRANPNCNSVAMLIRHLNGNISQWLINTLSQTGFRRNRAEEFKEDKSFERNNLQKIIDQLERDLLKCIDQVNIDYLITEFTIQGFKTSGYGIINHVTEHCSYHCGQITLLTKIILDIDTAYYEGMDLEEKH